MEVQTRHRKRVQPNNAHPKLERDRGKKKGGRVRKIFASKKGVEAMI